MAASADKQQLQRIKAVFEKKNQKSAHSISQLQKKLEQYNKRTKDLQIHQNQKLQNQSHRQPREVLRDVSQGLRYVLNSEPFFQILIFFFLFFIEMLVEIYEMEFQDYLDLLCQSQENLLI